MTRPLNADQNTPPPARLLDITRLMRRAGKVLTGVDRVELAYLRAFLADEVPVFGLVRARLGYLLLDSPGLDDLIDSLAGPDPDRVEEAQKRRTWRRARKRAIGRVPPALLGRMLRGGLPRGTAYINVGHSNLTDRVFASVRAALDGQITVMIHDVIPLDYPQYQRPETAPKFRTMLDRVAAGADLVLCNSADTETRLAVHCATLPRTAVAHLGIDCATAAPGDVPDHIRRDRPYFICVGTIEPRKNHALLLDIWEDLGPDAPGLIIAGNRGWENEAVLDRLDMLPIDGPITEAQGLSDGAIAALVSGAQGLLMPSFAEGYGLPAVEAAASGVPMILNDLGVYREVLGDIPIYADVSDRYLWINKTKELAHTAQDRSAQPEFRPPTWEAHFKIVLRLT